MTQSEMPNMPPKARHVATYATDKRKGGYLIRVEGPDAAMFAGRKVPVTLRNGQVHTEELDRLIWTGSDVDSGKPVSLYTFIPQPRDEQEIPF